jgi:hypothetical protein
LSSAVCAPPSTHDVPQLPFSGLLNTRTSETRSAPYCSRAATSGCSSAGTACAVHDTPRLGRRIWPGVAPTHDTPVSSNNADSFDVLSG